jgi:flagellar biosynthesis protein
MASSKQPLTNKAAALQYLKNSQTAPKLLAKGKGELANRIIQKANDFNIPIFENELLVDSLINLEIGDEIPPRLYSAVVDIFVWLIKTEGKSQKSV